MKKYQIFISSTFSDLQIEREAILNCVLEMSHIPIGMELFNAVDDNQWNLIKRNIDDSDYYVIIVSDKYGSVDSKGVGYTEKEFDYALEKGIPVIAFVRNQESIGTLPFEKRESLNRAKLDLFKDKLLLRHVKKWDSVSDLTQKFTLSLIQLMNNKPQVGWVRANSLEHKTETFYTLDDASENNFSHLIKGAKKVHILARTAVNLLSLYEREISEIIKNGCEVRFLFVGSSSDAVKYIYGSNPELYFENARKMHSHIKSIKNTTGKDIEVKTINHAPTVSIIYVEKDNDVSFVVVQFYFLHSRLGRDRPIFKLTKNDRWFFAFKDEFDKLWSSADIWN